MVLLDVCIKNVDKRRVCGDHREMQNDWDHNHYHTGLHAARVMVFSMVLHFVVMEISKRAPSGLVNVPVQYQCIS